MLSFDLKGERFMYRVAGVAAIDGPVLVQRFEGEEFWCLPGGRVEMGEPAEEALAREMREELGSEAGVGRLLWVIDNFFRYRGVDYHELGLYFVITLPEGCSQAAGGPWTAPELDGTLMHFAWHAPDRLGELDLKPSCLKQMLRKLPKHAEYVVHRDS
jgi:8-oxo-dGTP pyrophosphatase MutT (NUDIX family)